MRTLFRKWAARLSEDWLEALSASRQIAEQALGGAELGLGLQYATGAEVAQDYVEAHRWLDLVESTTSGEVHDLAALARDEVTRRMSPEQIAAAERLEGKSLTPVAQPG